MFINEHSETDGMKRSALFSEDRVYRYSLEREWGNPGKIVTFVLLNPSTADAFQDDPTLRRAIGYARVWGFERLVFVNAFAFRTSSPKKLKQATHPTGPDNDFWIRHWVTAAELVVAAWGSHGTYRNRSSEVRRILPVGAKCLGKTKAGEPKHILYLPKAQPLENL